jgi:hypothetical protein
VKTARLINIFIVVFVDLFGFSLILPRLPYYAQNLGAWAPGVVSAALMLWVVLFTYRRVVLIKTPALPPAADVVNG